MGASVWGHGLRLVVRLVIAIIYVSDNYYSTLAHLPDIYKSARLTTSPVPERPRDQSAVYS